MAETPPELWIVIPHWDRFQHYSDRNPAWIKVYTELNSDPNWCGVGLIQRGLLVTLWIEYARSRGQVSLARARAITGLRNLYQSLNPLIHAGFIELVASRPLAHTRSREKRREEKKGASGRASTNSTPAAPEEEPERDPEALERIRQLAERIGRHE